MVTILLVEDNEASRDALSRRLERHGYHVLLAVDGRQAVTMARASLPDLILMDLGLPVLDGWDATRQLKSDAATRHIPIIVLSAHAMTNDRDRALAAGGDDFDTKPIRFQSPSGKDRMAPRRKGGRLMNRRGSILVVDDSEYNRDALSRRLEQKGFLVETAADGSGALECAASRQFDLVLLDVEMPGMSGLDVLSRLRESRSQTELPVIMVTARAQSADIIEALGLGANDYITKPVDFPVALARIRTHLSHKWAVADLHESEERYAVAVRGANDGLWDWNLATNEVYWSPRWKELLGYGEGEIGTDPEEWLSRIHDEDARLAKETLEAYLASGIGHYESEHRIRHRDGTYRWMRCRGAAVTDGQGHVTRMAGALTDITETKVADALTGLPNRLLFVDLLDRAIKRTERHPNYVFATLVLGLDRFKVVNQSLGVLSADRLLISVARRLQSSLRGTDVVSRDGGGFTLARLGGDEFMVLLDDITDASDAIRVAERLRAALCTPFDVEGHQVFTSAVVGITVSTTGYERAEQVLQDAAIALHRAKAGNSVAYELFDPTMRERALTRLSSRPICGMPSTTRRLPSSTSRSSRSSPAPSRASRRSRAGTIPSAARSAP